MRVSILPLYILALLDLVHASCTFAGAPVVLPFPQVIAMSDLQKLITDLRTATPYTFTNTLTGVSGCATDPLTVTAYYTAYVNGRTYTAIPASATINVDGQDVYEYFTFPDLTVTALKPDQTFLVVISFNLLS